MSDVPDGRTAPPAPLALRQAFPPVATRAWEELARRDLQGLDDATRLLWRTEDGLVVKPFYRREDLDGLEAQTTAVPGLAPFVRGDATPWQAVEAPAWPDDAIRADRLHDAGATAVQELAWALADAVDRLAAATSRGQPVDEAARRIEFVYAVGSTYFVEIAKLRAARLVWAAAATAFGVSADAGAPRLHVRTARANKSVHDPYTNLLRATTEAMSAALGGAATLLVEPHGFEPHLAINVARILAEEAHLDAVADPAGGSYYIEALTDALAREAWASFQQIEAAGGYGAAVAAGLLERQLRATRSAQQDRLGMAE